jgi:hypothetical protein
MLKQKEPQMDLSQAFARDQQRQREIRMYGCTETELRDSVEHSITFKISGPVMVAAGLMSDAQEIVSFGPYDGDRLANVMESQRQMLNQAKWILFNYCTKGE